MDLVTLVTACALGVDPKLMQALVWQQSGGNPWAVSAPGEASPRIYTSLQDAVSATHALPDSTSIVRVGLAGLPVAAGSITPAVFLPCVNVAVTAQRITNLISQCAARPQNTPISCALAAYRGSWNRPNVEFARAVVMSLAANDAPNFDMPKGTSSDLLQIITTSLPWPNASASGPTAASEESERGWQSALFPSSLQTSAKKPNAAPAAAKPPPDEQETHASKVPVPKSKPASNGPFVNGSADRSPQ